jgi:hypothetical protein
MSSAEVDEIIRNGLVRLMDEVAAPVGAEEAIRLAERLASEPDVTGFGHRLPVLPPVPPKRPPRARPSWILAGATCLALVAALAVGLAVSTQNGRLAPAAEPAVDTSLTPPGWVPVDYDDAQLSAPPSWPVTAGGVDCAGSVQDVIGLGPARLEPTSNRFCLIGSQAATIAKLAQIPKQYAHEAPTILNGIEVFQGPSRDGSLSYFVPSLNVSLAAWGNLGRSVINTLTYSPRYIGLRAGTVTPESWKRVSADGVTFAVPGTWTASHSDIYGPGCDLSGLAYRTGAVVLDSDRRLEASSCPDMAANVGGLFSEVAPGVVVDESPSAMEFQPFSAPSGQCLSERRAGFSEIAACPFGSPSADVLYVSVTNEESGGAAPREFVIELGLGANGQVGQTILHSLRSSTPIRSLIG